MGQSSSTTEGQVLVQQYESSLNLFTTYEQGELKKIFDKICQMPSSSSGSAPPSSPSKTKAVVGFKESQLQSYIDRKLPKITTHRLYQVLKLLQLCGTSTQEEVTISQSAFVVAMAMVFKGTLDQHCHLIHCLATENREGIPAEELVKFVGDILQHYEEALKISNKMNDWRLECTVDSHEKFRSFVLEDAFNLPDGESKKILDESDVASWLQKKPLFQTLIVNIFHICFSPEETTSPQGAASTEGASSTTDDDDGHVSSLHETPVLPQCLNMDWKKKSTLLDLPLVLLLNQQLPHTCRSQWRYLFSSQTDGGSFATMMGHITKQGPVIIIVKDEDGNVFGGFASQSWQQGPNFTGTSQSFLFSATPNLGIHEASGQNDNYMYLNIDQQTLPNGLGMGGQFNYFGLWIDQEFGTGHSKAKPKCTTYDSPQLSAKEEFTIAAVEAWAVGPPPKAKDDDLYEEDQKSILDRDPTAQAILDLVGKERKSEGLREEEPTADIPEVHTMPAL